MVSLLAGLEAAAVAYVLLIREWHLRWGATDAGVARPMPGDEIVPAPQLQATRAVTILARPEEVWPWLVQMGGYTRAGWYSYRGWRQPAGPGGEVVGVVGWGRS